jgi:hypothetical protein
MGDKGTGHKESTCEIGVQDSLPLGEGKISDRFAIVNTGIVDEDMYFSKASDHLLFEATNILFGSDICLELES